MTRRLNLPDTASVAQPSDNGKLFAPSAARNEAAIADLVDRIAPATGRALEIASGTGQHVARLAGIRPGLTWQPSDADPARLGSISAWIAETGHASIAPPVVIDATSPGWGNPHAGQDFLMLVNLLHLISWPEARILIAESARALNPGGRLMFYGPFMRDGRLTSLGDETFHASLTAQDPEIGYKPVEQIEAALDDAGVQVLERVEMPANNLAIVAERAGPAGGGDVQGDPP